MYCALRIGRMAAAVLEVGREGENEVWANYKQERRMSRFGRTPLSVDSLTIKR